MRVVSRDTVADAREGDRPITRWQWFVAWALWASILATSLVVNAVEQPFAIPLEVRAYVVALLPQGWGFFTRNPREPVLSVFERRGARWREVSLRVGRARYFFGLDRTARVRSFEMGTVLAAVPLDRWHACDEPAVRCFDRLTERPVPVRLADRVPVGAALCGTLALQVGEKLPWAWSAQRDRVVMPSRVALVEISCGADRRGTSAERD